MGFGTTWLLLSPRFSSCFTWVSGQEELLEAFLWQVLHHDSLLLLPLAS
ncbi:hypothetical protein SLEP1_g14239 [Rubroshorea leprosula]|uniref:Uncharacterized protein n=1 Tax=Rubroshorea leprosula TaxID=152421 RepID=A0AAV5ISZ3_9ROSI|nr:hypothetical protein SLEP1_g14239 [Rubroshorea leprosula]